MRSHGKPNHLNSKCSVQLIHSDLQAENATENGDLSRLGEGLGVDSGSHWVGDGQPDGGGAAAGQHGHGGGVTLDGAVNLVAGGIGGAQGLGGGYAAEGSTRGGLLWGCGGWCCWGRRGEERGEGKRER